jgi:hypothetical protein
MTRHFLLELVLSLDVRINWLLEAALTQFAARSSMTTSPIARRSGRRSTSAHHRTWSFTWAQPRNTASLALTPKWMNQQYTRTGFPQARAQLHAWGQEVLPSLLAGLASSFSLQEPPVKFVPTDRAVYGITNEGRTVLDTRVTVSASAYVSTRVSAEQAADRLAFAMDIASGMKQKVARFFHLALHEDDPLKRFLYFFLAIEIETHATFSMIDHASQLSSLVLPPEHAAATTKAFLDGQRQKWTNLQDRFVWCLICAWPHLSDSDAEEFKRLKTIRDAIAHGSLATPPADAVRTVEKLAAKLQLPAR